MQKTNVLSFAKLLLAHNPLIAMSSAGYAAVMDSITNADYSGLRIMPKAYTGQVIGTERTIYYYNNNGVAVIPIEGIIIPKGTMFDCTYQNGLDDYEVAIDTALNDSAIKGIVLAIDSGGGSAAGVEQFYQMLRRKTKVKPIKSYIETTGASAAYYIAAATNEITLSGQTTIVGSIGTLIELADLTAMYDAMGVKFRTVTATKSYNKRLPNDATNEQIDNHLITELLDPFNEIFIANMKQGRANTIDKIKAGKGTDGTPRPFTGAIYMGKDAINNGLADGIGTLQMVVNSFNITNNNTKNGTENGASNANANMNFLDGVKALFTANAVTAQEDTAMAFEGAKDASLELAAQLDAISNELQMERGLLQTAQTELSALKAELQTVTNSYNTEKAATSQLTEALEAATAKESALQTQVDDLELMTQTVPKIVTNAGHETETANQKALREAKENIQKHGY